MLLFYPECYSAEWQYFFSYSYTAESEKQLLIRGISNYFSVIPQNVEYSIAILAGN
jgi:hypothetical protein